MNEMFVLLVKIVSQQVCRVLDGSQMGCHPSLPLDKFNRGVGDVLDEIISFFFSSLCKKLEAEESMFVWGNEV